MNATQYLASQVAQLSLQVALIAAERDALKARIAELEKGQVKRGVNDVQSTEEREPT